MLSTLNFARLAQIQDMVLNRISLTLLFTALLPVIVSCKNGDSISSLITAGIPEESVTVATTEQPASDTSELSLVSDSGNADESMLEQGTVSESANAGDQLSESSVDADAVNTGNQQPPAPTNRSNLIDPESWNYDEVYAKPGFELVFSDEFNSYSLNPDRWNTQLRWDGEFNGLWYEYRVINGEKQFYVNVLTRDGEHRDKLLQPSGFTPFGFDGFRLAIRATANPFLDSRVPTRNDEDGRDISFGRFEPLLKRQPFLSGALASYDKFSQKYGYFEARMRLPAHVGTFPAFWLHHQRRESEDTQRSEIDIMENLGHAPGVVYNAFHYFDFVTEANPGQPNFVRPEPSGRVTVGGNFSDNFHVYAVDWRPGSIVWYIDDQPVSWLSSPQVDYEEMYVILNLAIGGDWVNFPMSVGGLGRGENDFYPTVEEQDPLVFGNPEVEIDYVRVYQRTSDLQ